MVQDKWPVEYLVMRRRSRKLGELPRLLTEGLRDLEWVEDDLLLELPDDPEDDEEETEDLEEEDEREWRDEE